jgi:bifunctional non-homologous end joining protein LigD
MVLDLDPNIRSGKEPVGAEPELNAEVWKRTVQVAHSLHDMLGQLNLRSYLKTTGKTGLHIYVPVQRLYTSNQVREAARTIGQHLMQRIPEDVTMELRLIRRPDKVYFDANMNGRTKTLAAAYSPRPVAGARVSMPISWDQLDQAHPADFTVRTVPEILRQNGDAWGDFLSMAQRLP